MLVSLYTYFLDGTQLNVRVHECDCGNEPQYHPAEQKMNAYVRFINWPERDIRALAHVRYAKLVENELFVITDGASWHEIENDVLDIMARAHSQNESFLVKSGALALAAYQQSGSYATFHGYQDRKAAQVADADPFTGRMRDTLINPQDENLYD